MTKADYDTWRRAYPAVPDFDAELRAADDYYTEYKQPDGKWFFFFSNWLKKAHNAAVSNKQQEWKRKHGW